MADLTARQERFVAEFLICLNATKAAIKAGYAEKNADVQGPRLLGNVRVAAAVEAGKVTHARAAGVTTQWVVDKLRAIAEDEGAPHSARVSALTQLARYTGGFIERSESHQTGDISVVIRTFEDADEPPSNRLQ